MWRRLCFVSVAMDPIYSTPISYYRGYSNYCDVRGPKQSRPACQTGSPTDCACRLFVSLGRDSAGGVGLQGNSKIASSDLNLEMHAILRALKLWDLVELCGGI